MKCKKLTKGQIEHMKKLKKSKSRGDKYIYDGFKKILKKENYCLRGI